MHAFYREQMHPEEVLIIPHRLQKFLLLKLNICGLGKDYPLISRLGPVFKLYWLR